MIKPSQLQEKIQAINRAETIDQITEAVSRISGQQTLRVILIKYVMAMNRELENSTKAHRLLTVLENHVSAMQVELNK